MEAKKTVRIGAGAGYSGDRIEPAAELAQKGGIDYLVFECLAERTIAIAQQAKRKDPEQGHDPLLEERMRAVLGICHENGVKIITNMGAANPASAARKTAAIAKELGIEKLKIAYVEGDDVKEKVEGQAFPVMETGLPAAELGTIVSANAYLGAAPIVEALENGADVVITGRVADPALFLAPQIFTFGWAMDDWTRLGRGSIVGHLLECAGQVTGGYYAEPGKKDVDGLDRLGFPIAEVDAEGNAEITKVPGSGGRVCVDTCKEQVIYEIHDPARYLTPDVVVDFTGLKLSEADPDRVRVEGGAGHPKTGSLKASVGYLDGFIGEGQISYAGIGALERAKLAQEIVKKRLAATGVDASEWKYDLIGVNAIHGPASIACAEGPAEVRLRVAGRTASAKEAQRIGNEVETLYTNGPAGGGGAAKSVREVMAIASVLIGREAVSPTVHYLGD
jgi:hypothetical protein